MRLSSVAAIFLLLSLFWSSGSLVAAAGARAEIPQTGHDFGQVWDHQELSHTFIIKNTGDQPLKILEVDPDCACTVANYDRGIPPGGEGKITLALKPYSVLRKFEKKTRIKLSDSARADVTLVVKGMAQPSLEILPNHIVRFRGVLKEDLKEQVRFISHLPTHWEITKYETNLADKIDVALKAEQPGKIYVLEVKNKFKASGHYTGKIELFTNARNRPKIVVRVIADLYPESAVNP